MEMQEQIMDDGIIQIIFTKNNFTGHVVCHSLPEKEGNGKQRYH